MKFCSKCGAQLGDASIFCHNCGAKIEQSKEHIKRELRCVVHHNSGVVEVYTDCLIVKKKSEFLGLRPASVKKYLFSQLKGIAKHRKSFISGAFIHFDMGEGRSPDGGVLYDYAVEFKNNNDLDKAYMQIEAEYKRYNNL